MYEYGAVPLEAFTVAVPLSAPQLVEVADAEQVGDALKATVPLHSVVHPAASVTVTV